MKQQASEQTPSAISSRLSTRISSIDSLSSKQWPPRTGIIKSDSDRHDAASVCIYIYIYIDTTLTVSFREGQRYYRQQRRRLGAHAIARLERVILIASVAKGYI